MTGPQCFALGMIVGLSSVLLFTTTSFWRRFIWGLRGSTFRIVYDGDYFYPEKRFLWIFYVRFAERGHYERELSRTFAKKFIEEYLEKIDMIRKSKKEILRFQKSSDKFKC